MSIVRTRIAPSPTGFPHIGTIYQALFDLAYAKKYDGQFILRIEDTDRKRVVAGAEKDIYEILEWFGLHPDESPVHGGDFGPYRQSERLNLYKKYALELMQKGHAYYCFCTPKRLEKMRSQQQEKKLPSMYDKHCLGLTKSEVESNLTKETPYVVRMKVPKNQKIIFEDLVAGKVEFDSNVIDHQVLLKSDGFPTYHLAVVVDDHLMQISHVFRGKEWLSSTPKHKLLYDFFNWQMPVHAHLPLILNSDGKGKLSKRHGHASVDYYREQGFLPQAVLNYLSNIVWHHPQDKEIYSLDEFIKLMDIKVLNSTGVRFDLKKLEWMNGEHIRKSQKSKVKDQILEIFGDKYPEKLVSKLVPLAKERMKKLSEFEQYIRPFVDYKPAKLTAQEMSFLSDFIDLLSEDVSVWKASKLEKVAKSLVSQNNWSMYKAFMAVRLAVTGEKIGLPLFETMEILGKETVLNRLSQHLQHDNE